VTVASGRREVPPDQVPGQGARRQDHGWVHTLAVAIGGAALTLAFPEPSLAPLAWIALIPFFVLTTGATLRRGITLGFVFGIGFFGTLLVWITHIGFMGYIVLVAAQSAYVALFGGLWAIASRARSGAWRIVAASALWVVCEYLRSVFPVGGFTWGQLSQSQAELLWILRAASIGGGWLVSFIVVAVNAALAEALLTAQKKRLRGAAPFVLAAFAITLLPLALPANDATGRAIDVGIVQGNVPRNFTGAFLEKSRIITDSHERLTRSLANEGLDLIVWPESSVGVDPVLDEDVAGAIARSAQSAGAPMIVGGERDIDADHRRVVAFEVNQEGEIVDTYVKTHLVPFGEYVPYRRLLDWIPALDQVPRDAVPASEPLYFEIAGGRVAPVISFEGDFGSLVRKPIDLGGRLLVVATNTSTWGDSWASAQHVAFSRVRAAETGVWVVHGALSGISAFISPEGTIAARTPMWEATTLTRTVRFAEDTTPYVRFGDWVPVACALIAVAAIMLGLGARRGADVNAGGRRFQNRERSGRPLMERSPHEQ
jgi:apolipoprotein N-acyltransferase